MLGWVNYNWRTVYLTVYLMVMANRPSDAHVSRGLKAERGQFLTTEDVRLSGGTHAHR
jgi:hypothetical protein